MLSSAFTFQFSKCELSRWCVFFLYYSVSNSTEHSLALNINSLLPLISCLSYIFFHLWVKLSFILFLWSKAAGLLASNTLCYSLCLVMFIEKTETLLYAWSFFVGHFLFGRAVAGVVPQERNKKIKTWPTLTLDYGTRFCPFNFFLCGIPWWLMHE